MPEAVVVPTPQDVAQAMERLQGVVNHTPVSHSRTLDRLCGGNVYLKCENFQRVGAFKFRGAYHAISQLSSEQRHHGVITHSSGNHAQGVALAAQLLGVPASIVMPHDSPLIKQQATAGYGAHIIFCQAVAREQVTADLIQQHGYTLIHPYDNEKVIAGQGTAAWELLQEVGDLDLLFAPIGGGGLLSGTALAAAQLCSRCQVVGVEPEIADDAYGSFHSGQIVTLPAVPQTVADGLRTRAIGQRNLAVMRRYLHDLITVSEEAIRQTLLFVWQRLKLVIEPSSAVALAPILLGSYPVSGKRVGVILSGGNVDLPIFGQTS